MAYKSAYSYGGDGYTTTYSSNYYAYQIGIIFAIVIAGILFFGICVAVIYFGFVKRMRRSEKQRRTGTVALLRSNSISREPTTTYTSLRNGKSPQPRDAYIPNLETPIMQSSMHSQPVTYVQQPPPMYATQPGDPQSHRQLTSYPRQEASGSAHSHQSYATWKGATNGLQQNLMREQRTFSFHTSV